jgi:hypothetical protein
MPPQQAYGLLDFVDYIDHFRTHGASSSLLCALKIQLPPT